jgi:hypothetical protein
MAFNLGGFIAGASNKLVERIEDEEERIQVKLKEQREDARFFSRDQRTKKADRARDLEDLAKESAMYHTEEEVREIMALGYTGAKATLANSKSIYNSGGDPSLGYNWRKSLKEVGGNPDKKLPEISSSTIGKDSTDDLTKTVGTSSKIDVVTPTTTPENLPFMKKKVTVKETYSEIDEAIQRAYQELSFAQANGDTKKVEKLGSFIQELANSAGKYNKKFSSNDVGISKESRSNIIQKELQNQYALSGVPSLDGVLTEKLQTGTQGKVAIAQIAAASKLLVSWEGNDPMLTENLKMMRSQAINSAYIAADNIFNDRADKQLEYTTNSKSLYHAIEVSNEDKTKGAADFAALENKGNKTVTNMIDIASFDRHAKTNIIRHGSTVVFFETGADGKNKVIKKGVYSLRESDKGVIYSRYGN